MSLMETEVHSRQDSGERGRQETGGWHYRCVCDLEPAYGLRSELSSFKTNYFEIMALHSRSRFSDIQWVVPSIWQESYRVARTSLLARRLKPKEIVRSFST